MEASGGTTTAPPQTDPGQGAPAGAPAAAPAEPDRFSQLEQSIVDFGEKLPQQVAHLLAQQNAPEPQPDDLAAELERLYGSGEPDPGQPDPNDPYGLYQAEQQQPQFDPRSLAELMDRRMDKQLSEFRNELIAERRNDAFYDLEDRYPELRDPNVQKEILAAAQEDLNAIAPLLPPGSDPRALLQAAPFVERIYLAEKARKASEAEQPAGGSTPDLERPGGASPPQQEEPDDEGARIVAAGRGKNPLFGF